MDSADEVAVLPEHFESEFMFACLEPEGGDAGASAVHFRWGLSGRRVASGGERRRSAELWLGKFWSLGCGDVCQQGLERAG